MLNVQRTLVALLLALPFCGMAQADTIASWKSVPMPPPPELKAFTVTDPGHTALLLLDFDTSTCNSIERPTCAASLPYVANLLSKSREANLMIVYSLTSVGTLAAVPSVIAAKGGETVVQSGVDKFFNTDLETALKNKGIQTVIVTGTMAHGAVLPAKDPVTLVAHSFSLNYLGCPRNTNWLCKPSVFFERPMRQFPYSIASVVVR
jgi:hypothetical protein